MTLIACANTGKLQALGEGNTSQIPTAGFIGTAYKKSNTTTITAEANYCNAEIRTSYIPCVFFGDLNGENVALVCTVNSNYWMKVNDSPSYVNAIMTTDGFTEVNGSDVTWLTAMTNMNECLSTNHPGFGYQYVENTGTDAAAIPLVLQAITTSNNEKQNPKQNMRVKTKVTAFALAVTVVMAEGCRNNEDTPSEAAKYITVNTSIGQMTRVATDKDGSQRFGSGDEITIYAWLGTATAQNQMVVNGVTNRYDGTMWTASPQMLWADQESGHYFIGIHPAKKSIASVVTELTADDYTLDALDQEASDLLVATNLKGLSATTAPGGMVDLDFDHVMAKLIVNLKFRNQWGGTPTVQSMTVQDAATKAKVDYLNKVVTVDDTSKEDFPLAALATPQTGYALSYASIMVPQSGFQSVTVTIGGSDYTYTHSGEIKLESGKYTTVNLIVGRDRIELDEVTVNDWQQGDVINGGEAE